MAIAAAAKEKMLKTLEKYMLMVVMLWSKREKCLLKM